MDIITGAMVSSCVICTFNESIQFGHAGWPPDVPVAAISKDRVQRTPEHLRATPLDNGRWLVRFAIKDPNAQRMRLAGSFNMWNPNEGEMTKSASGEWTLEIELRDNTHLYKFVRNDGEWRPDPLNNFRAPDGHGGQNTIIALGADALLDPKQAKTGDGAIVGVALRHNPTDWRDLQPFGNQQFEVSAQTLRNDVERVWVVFDDGHTQPLTAKGGSDLFDRWTTTLSSDREGHQYTFVFQDGELRVRHPNVYQLDQATAPNVRTPDWAKDAIWYQVMVERFRDGTPLNNHDPVRPWTYPWYQSSPWEGKDGQSFYKYFVFGRHYGGDLQGLQDQLPYLKSLGVNAIYLNPIFQASTHHKYNATDFRHIDEHYGAGEPDFAETIAKENLTDPSSWTWSKSDEIFLEFLRTAKAKGFRVIIDGVFNHVGTAHPAFVDVQKNGQSSPFADWFSIRSWDPFEYDGWAGFGELPAFRKNDEHGLASESLREHIFAITRRWMDPDGDGDPSDGVDGWRLDVPEEVPMAFWVEWCALVRSINPEAYIVGEIWKAKPEWLDGRTFDALMNYPFAEIALEWIGNREHKISASEAARRFAAHRETYPSEVTYALQNLVDSHDTDRLVSKLHNPDRAYDSGNREQEDQTYDGSKPPARAYQQARLVALLQMTSPGAPMIYYGDEVGLWGSDDPNNRKPMLWKDLEPYEESGMAVMDDHLAFYQAAVSLRNDFTALRTGSIETILTDDEQDVMAFVREDDANRLLVILNANDDPAKISVPVDGEWRQIFGASSGPPQDCVLSGISGAVYLHSKP